MARFSKRLIVALSACPADTSIAAYNEAMGTVSDLWGSRDFEGWCCVWREYILTLNLLQGENTPLCYKEPLADILARR